MPHIRFWGTALGLALFALPTPAYAAKQYCQPLAGKIDVSFVTDGCESPVGLCTKGRVSGDLMLWGARTSYTVHGVSPTPGDAMMETSMAYNGTLTLKMREGTLVIEDIGLFDKSNGLIGSQSRTIRGTGAFENANGSVFTYGTASATGFSSQLRGKLCVPW